MKILLQFPTKLRPDRFTATARAWLAAARGPKDGLLLNVAAEVCDAASLAAGEKLRAEDPRVTVTAHGGSTKIAAFNALGAHHAGAWQILQLLAEDFEEPVEGWDIILRRDMHIHFPALDGLLHYWDGCTGGPGLCTHPAVGRRFYEHFGYLHCPEYTGAFSDDEMTAVAKRMHKHAFICCPIAKHNWVGRSPDSLCRADRRGFGRDKEVFERRQAEGFGLTRPMLSVMICTLESRAKPFALLADQLYAEREKMERPGDVEILYAKDLKQMTVGEKRQALLEQARGKFICFIDDDDSVPLDYLRSLLEAVAQHKSANGDDPDCVVFASQFVCRGVLAGRTDFDVANPPHQNTPALYLRSPNHLCPVRRELAIQVGFNKTNFGEDSDYARRLKPLIRSQAVVHDRQGDKKVLYRYNFDERYTETQISPGVSREVIRA